MASVRVHAVGSVLGILALMMAWSSEVAALNQQYTVWGRVIYGMEVLDDLAPGRPPSNPDEIKRLNPVLELLDQQ